MRRSHPGRPPTARSYAERHRPASSGPPSESSTPLTTVKTLQATWQASQAEIGAAINAYGTSITTGPERLVRFAAEGYTGDADAAMTDAIDSITKIDRAGGLLDTIDNLKNFHTSLQRLNDIPTTWLDGHGDVQLANTCSMYRTRKDAFETATAKLERYEQIAMITCLDEYSKRPGPQIMRKRDPGTTVRWDDFQDLCFYKDQSVRHSIASSHMCTPLIQLQCLRQAQAILPQYFTAFHPVSNAVLGHGGRFYPLTCKAQRTQLLRGVPTGVIEAERSELDPLTLAEGKLYDFV